MIGRQSWDLAARGGSHSGPCWLPHSCISLRDHFLVPTNQPISPKEKQWLVPITTALPKTHPNAICVRTSTQFLVPPAPCTRTMAEHRWRIRLPDGMAASTSLPTARFTQKLLGRSVPEETYRDGPNLLADSRWACVAQHFGRARLSALVQSLSLCLLTPDWALDWPWPLHRQLAKEHHRLPRKLTVRTHTRLVRSPPY